MGFAWEFIGILFGVAIPVAIIVGIVYLVLRIKAGTSLSFSYRATLRIYFSIVLLVSVGLCSLGGASTLLKVGLGEAFGNEFSYGNIYEEHRYSIERETRGIIAKEEITSSEGRDELRSLPEKDELRSLPEKIDLARTSSLINGASLTIIGLFLLVVHFLGRHWVETNEERSDLLRKLYLMAGLAFFSITTIVSLAAGVPETLRYVFLDTTPGENSPGETLSIAIVSLPVWIYYLIFTLRTVRIRLPGPA